MRRIYFFVFLMTLSTRCLLAQVDQAYVAPSRESTAYNQLRREISLPPYGYGKIQKLLFGLKTDDNDQEKIKENDYQSLSLREKFTYHMAHGESYSQVCDIMPQLTDEHKKIFGQLPDMFMEYNWSDRQKKFLRNNRDSVIKLMKECIVKEKRVGVNFKHAIILLNATDMIPFLIKTYKTNPKKDGDILTVLMLLMKNNQYAPFINSISHKKLYSEESDYQSHIVYNSANEDLVIKRATGFYNELGH